MARYTGSVCRLCRRQGEKLMLKGERCTTKKCALERRNLPPGKNRPQRRKISDRGMQLREKQKARCIYGVLEHQFRRHFDEALRQPGVTGENLLRILEMRLDNVVYRLGFADSRRQARQIVRHRLITVNQRRINIPSYHVEEGDIIGWSSTGKQTEICKNISAQITEKVIPSWLKLDMDNLTGKVLSRPNRADIELKVDEKVIVEYYSR